MDSHRGPTVRRIRDVNALSRCRTVMATVATAAVASLLLAPMASGHRAGRRDAQAFGARMNGRVGVQGLRSRPRGSRLVRLPTRGVVRPHTISLSALLGRARRA